MYRIRFTVSYDGTDFLGWQKQPNFSNTIQQELESAFSKIFNENVQVVASGRTDAGVHARAQVAHATVSKDPRNYNLTSAINGLTSDAISTQNFYLCANKDFHAQGSAKAKTYHYYVHNSPVSNPYRLRYAHWLKRPIDLSRLNSLSELLLGTHDFKSFQTSGTEVLNTIRTIHIAEWSLVKPQLLRFQISGDGFLKQMVRNIVGTLLKLEELESKKSELEKIIRAQDRSAAWSTAPAKGLHLHHVDYHAESLQGSTALR